jgi:hypothetical protein
MRRALMIVVTVVCFVSPVRAQQGPAYPTPGSTRGETFPKHVSPTGSNPTNWVRRQHEYTDPNGPNSRRNRGYGGYRHHNRYHHYY